MTFGSKVATINHQERLGRLLIVRLLFFDDTGGRL